jgi:hypothetical protein
MLPVHPRRIVSLSVGLSQLLPVYFSKTDKVLLKPLLAISIVFELLSIKYVNE